MSDRPLSPAKPKIPNQSATGISPQRGMTLIEVLVALGIVAVALLTGLKATGALTDNAGRQSRSWLAQLCADNELTRLRLLRQLPDLGTREVPCTQADQPFTVQLVVNPTPNPNFRRVDARVLLQADPVLQVSTLMGQQ